MQISIRCHERYPEYSVEDSISQFGTTVEVDAETVKRWKRVENEFQAVQDEMEKHIEQNRTKTTSK